MDTLLVTPQNKTQFELVYKTLLNMNVSVKTIADKNIASENNNDNLPDHVKKGIEKGLKQIENGECSPHAEVMNRIKKKYLKNESNLVG